MAQQPPNYNQRQNPERHKDADTATKKTIKAIKEQYCNELKSLIGDLHAAEENNKGLIRVYHQKKCFFVKTEKNYRIVRNLELSVGIELIQASDDIKNNLTDYVTSNVNLVKALGEVLKAAKNAKAKFSDLRDAACKLDACRKDSCNKSQMIILTGKSYDCGESSTENPPPDCENAAAILDDLVSTPESFSKDIDIIFGASADVTGIQTFSNIPALVPFQADIATKSKKLDDFIQDRLKKGNDDLKKAQDDFSSSIKELTKSGHALYNKRDEIDAVRGTKNYLCHDRCECITEGDDRLKRCKGEICEICQDVTDTYCKEKQDRQTGAA